MFERIVFIPFEVWLLETPLQMFSGVSGSFTATVVGIAYAGVALFAAGRIFPDPKTRVVSPKAVLLVFMLSFLFRLAIDYLGFYNLWWGADLGHFLVFWGAIFLCGRYLVRSIGSRSTEAREDGPLAAPINKSQLQQRGLVLSVGSATVFLVGVVSLFLRFDIARGLSGVDAGNPLVLLDPYKINELNETLAIVTFCTASLTVIGGIGLVASLIFALRR